MLNKNQLRVFRFLWNEPAAVMSIAEIARGAKLAYAVAWKVLKEFERNGIVSVVRKKAHLCSLDLDSELCLGFWELWNLLRKQELTKKQGYGNFARAVDFVVGETKPVFLAVFGSVARKQAKKGSDLDLLVCVRRDFDAAGLGRKIRARYFVEAKITMVRERELREYLEQKRQVYREVWADGIAWAGARKYFDLMKNLWK